MATEHAYTNDQICYDKGLLLITKEFNVLTPDIVSSISTSSKHA